MLNAYRVKEKSTTAGLGAYELVASGGNLRRFRDALASGAGVHYVAADAANYEIGIGVLTTGSPDSLSRDTVLASSNGGAKVNWQAGTRDLFIDPSPGSVPVIEASGARSVSFADIGALLVFTGASGATWSLPAAATVGDAFSFFARNAGTADVTLDPSGAETIDGAATLVLAPGEGALVAGDGTKWRSVIAVPPSAAGKLVQRVIGTYATYSSTTAVIPQDDTIPQNTEGTEIVTASITPKKNTNRLRISVLVVGTKGTQGNVTVGLFQDSGASAIAVTHVGLADAFGATINLAHEMDAGTTSATTFKVRVGVGAGTFYFNGGTSTRLYGGTEKCLIIIDEIEP